MSERTAGDAARMFDDLAGAVSGPPTDGELRELGEFAATTVLLRTKKGLDVDRHPFRPYSTRYAAERAAHGLQKSPVDLTRTGHMLGSMEVVPGAGEVKVAIMSEVEVGKAAANNFGVDKNVTVQAHTRSSYMHSKQGTSLAPEKQRRISRADASKKRTGSIELREHAVSEYTRNQKTPQREFMDVRAPEELEAIAEMFGDVMVKRLDEIFSRR